MFRFARQRSNRKNRVRSRFNGFEVLERREMLSGAPPKVVNVEVGSTSWSSAFVQYLKVSGQGAYGYSIPRGSSAQSASLTWDNIDQIMITFSEDVDVDVADLSLSGKNHTDYTFSDFRYYPDIEPNDPNVTVSIAIWTLSAPLDRDRLRIDLDATGSDPVKAFAGGAILDGEWTNNVSTVSGNGTAGGDFQFCFNVLPTDVNNTGNINNLDSSAINQLNGKTTTSAGYIAKRDINGDGVIDNTDWYKAVNRSTQTLPTGTPAGTNNDAPTIRNNIWLTVEGVSPSGSISLRDYFDDAESGSAALTYSIVSNDNPSLFGSASIDQSTGTLTVNAASGASGRANITIRGTDPSGLSVESVATVDVNYVNQPPHISNYLIDIAGGNTWIISGIVTDPDDDVSNFIVEFFGVIETRAAVNEYGYFQFAVVLASGQCGTEFARTYDPHGQVSNTVSAEMGYLT